MKQEIPYINQIGEKDWDTKFISILRDHYKIEVNFNRVSSAMLQVKERDLDFEFPQSFKYLYLELGYFKLGSRDLEIFSLEKIHKLRDTLDFKFIIEGLDEHDSMLAKDLIIFAVDSDGSYYFLNPKSEIIQFHFDHQEFIRKHKNFNDFIVSQIIDLSWGFYGAQEYESAKKLKKKLKIELS
jgi:hypothetical protein